MPVCLLEVERTLDRYVDGCVGFQSRLQYSRAIFNSHDQTFAVVRAPADSTCTAFCISEHGVPADLGESPPLVHHGAIR
jgi:hypothetical protein